MDRNDEFKPQISASASTGTVHVVRLSDGKIVRLDNIGRRRDYFDDNLIGEDIHAVLLLNKTCVGNVPTLINSRIGTGDKIDFNVMIDIGDISLPRHETLGMIILYLSTTNFFNVTTNSIVSIGSIIFHQDLWNNHATNPGLYAFFKEAE